MTKNVIQIRMPEKLADAIEGLVKKGLYKNRSEVVIDALRHFLGSEKKSGISLVIQSISSIALICVFKHQRSF